MPSIERFDKNSIIIVAPHTFTSMQRILTFCYYCFDSWYSHLCLAPWSKYAPYTGKQTTVSFILWCVAASIIHLRCAHTQHISSLRFHKPFVCGAVIANATPNNTFSSYSKNATRNRTSHVFGRMHRTRTHTLCTSCFHRARVSKKSQSHTEFLWKPMEKKMR